MAILGPDTGTVTAGNRESKLDANAVGSSGIDLADVQKALTFNAATDPLPRGLRSDVVLIPDSTTIVATSGGETLYTTETWHGRRGIYNINEGVMAIVDGQAKTFIAPSTAKQGQEGLYSNALERRLRELGYQKDESLGVPCSNFSRPHPNHATTNQEFDKLFAHRHS